MPANKLIRMNLILNNLCMKQYLGLIVSTINMIGCFHFDN